MNWRLRRMLEPGERIVLRSSDGNLVRLGLGFMTVLLGCTLFRNLLELELHDPRFGQTVAGVLILLPALLLGFLLMPFRTNWMLTDRRVLRRNGESVPLDAVEEARLGDSALFLRGSLGEWTLEFPPKFSAGPGLYEVLGPRLRDTGMPVLALADMLEPGERVLRHIPPAWAAWLRWPMLLSGPMAVATAVLWPDFARDRFLFSPFFVAIMYGVLLSDIVAFWRIRGWHTVLTDRRLLRRRPEWPSRCDAIPLEFVTAANWDRKRRKLVVSFEGRSVDIFCLRRTARRILDALERVDRGEALP